MNLNIEQFVRSLQSRQFNGSRYGIGFASSYLRSIQGCLDGSGACPTKVFGLAGEEQWKSALKEAESRLTYCHEDMAIESHLKSGDLAGLGFKAAVDAATQEAEDKAIPSGAAMVFDAVITSTRKDRDGDVLEAGGAAVDPHAPLLWQHMMMQPIGKFVKETTRDGKKVAAKLAIIDSELGRDAAQLVEFGALRISHGFLPIDYEPLDDTKEIDETYAGGWRVKKYEVIEVSLVSVPSNVDALITAFSRNKLKHPAVKGFAKGAFTNRSLIVQGVDVPKECGCKTEKNAAATAVAAETASTQDASATTKTKAAEPAGTKDVSVEGAATAKAASPTKTKAYGVTGSWEWIESCLHETARNHLLANGVSVGEHDYVCLNATYQDEAVIRHCRYSPSSETYYRSAWEMVDGKPKWTGELTEVELTMEFTEKSFEPVKAMRELRFKSVVSEKFFMAVKAGRKLSRKNEDRLSEIVELLEELLEKTGMKKSEKALLSRAATLAKEIVAELYEGDNGDEGKPKDDEPDGQDGGKGGVKKSADATESGEQTAETETEPSTKTPTIVDEYESVLEELGIG